MEAGWYLKIADKEVGPLSARQLRAMADRGQIAPFDPICKVPEGSWVPAGSIKGLFTTADSASERPKSQAGSEPAAAGADKPHGAAQRKLPVAQSVVLPVAQPVATPPSVAAPASPTAGGFHIDTGEDASATRRTARGGAASPGPRKRRRNEALVVAAVLVVVGVAVAAVGVALSRRAVGTPTSNPGEAQGQDAPKEKGEHEKVVIPGLDEYLGEAAPQGPTHADTPPPAAGKRIDAPRVAAEAEAEAELKAEKVPAKGDGGDAAEEPPAMSEDDGGPISIPGVTDEQSMEDADDDFSFSDDPNLQKAREELRRQQAEKDRAGRGGNREK